MPPMDDAADRDDNRNTVDAVTLTVSEESSGARVDQLVTAEISGHSRAFFQKLIRNGFM